MKIVSILLCSSACWAQLQIGTATANGVTMLYVTRLEKPIPGIVNIGGGVLTTDKIIKRHLCDLTQHVCFGYDLKMEPASDGRYRLTFSPLSITPEKLSEIFPKVKNWRVLPSPQQLTTEMVRGGDTVALDIFVNPSTGQKIVDYITINKNEGRHLTASGAARDFSVEDGVIKIDSPHLSVNGQEVEGAANPGMGISGAHVWIYVEGRGRFVFTLVPRTDLGFQKAGEIRGSTMVWRWANDQFSLNADARIAPGEGAYNVYVFNSPNWRPRSNAAAQSGFLMGAGGSLESLIR